MYIDYAEFFNCFAIRSVHQHYQFELRCVSSLSSSCTIRSQGQRMEEESEEWKKRDMTPAALPFFAIVLFTLVFLPFVLFHSIHRSSIVLFSVAYAYSPKKPDQIEVHRWKVSFSNIFILDVLFSCRIIAISWDEFIRDMSRYR